MIRNTKNKIIVASLSIVLASSLVFANAEIKTEAENIIESSSYGQKIISENKLQGMQDEAGFPTYRNETILNWYYFNQIANSRGQEVVGKETKMVALKEVPKENPQQNATNVDEFVSVKGYCFIMNDIHIGKQPGTLRVDCETNAGAITMFANLVNVDERASLIVDPKYIEKDGVRFQVTSSVVTNESKTSYNIATWVNDRKLSSVGYSAVSLSADELKTSSNEYLKALEESKKKQDVQFITTTDGAGNSFMQPVQNTSIEKPDPLDYLIKGGINVLTTSIKAAADLFKSDLPFLYEVAGKTKIWIDLKVNKKGEYVKWEK